MALAPLPLPVAGAEGLLLPSLLLLLLPVAGSWLGVGLRLPRGGEGVPGEEALAVPRGLPVGWLGVGLLLPPPPAAAAGLSVAREGEAEAVRGWEAVALLLAEPPPPLPADTVACALLLPPCNPPAVAVPAGALALGLALRLPAALALPVAPARVPVGTAGEPVGAAPLAVAAAGREGVERGGEGLDRADTLPVALPVPAALLVALRAAVPEGERVRAEEAEGVDNALALALAVARAGEALARVPVGAGVSVP